MFHKLMVFLHEFGAFWLFYRFELKLDFVTHGNAFFP